MKCGGGCEVLRGSDVEGGEGHERTLEYMNYEYNMYCLFTKIQFVFSVEGQLPLWSSSSAFTEK